MNKNTLADFGFRLADQLVREHEPLSKEWEHEPGILLRGLGDVYAHTGKAEYLQFLKDSLDPLIAEDGTIKGYDPETYELDNIVPGRALFRLYDATHDDRYRLAADSLAKQMETHPLASFGNYLHKKVFPEILFIDSIYMGMPFLAEYEARFGQRNFDQIVDNILTAYQKNYKADIGLMVHGYHAEKTEMWADSETGNSRTFWGRGMGWYTLGIVEVLDHLPKDHPRRHQLVEVLVKLLEGVVRHQSDEGVWYQVMDQPQREGNYQEASASAMFACALAKSVLKGYVPDSYTQAALKAYEGLLKVFLKERNGKLVWTGTCASGGLGVKHYRDGSFESYACEATKDDDLKGIGVFLMATVQADLLSRKADS